jgi:hypothetical protein
MATTTPQAHESTALAAATVCEAFPLTVAENSERIALRTLEAESELTFAEMGPCRASRYASPRTASSSAADQS